MFAVTRTNLRTGETRTVRTYNAAGFGTWTRAVQAAEARAAAANELARACRMYHILHRAVWTDAG